MEIINTEYAARDGGHYSSGVKFNQMLFISGQLSINPETGERPAGGIAAEMSQALENMELVLRAAGLTRNDVLVCRVYIPDVGYWPECNKIYAEFFGTHKPARVVIPTNPLYGGCLAEVEAIAAAED